MLELDVIVSSVSLGEHDTTGLLPVGFEFERCGGKYDHFDVSTEGFIAFAHGGRRRGLPTRVRLVDDRGWLGAGRVTYGLRGVAPRRRLVVAIVERGPLGTTLEVTVHERTGIVEVSAGDQSFGDPTIRQLDMVHSSLSRVNSARKMG